MTESKLVKTYSTDAMFASHETVISSANDTSCDTISTIRVENLVDAILISDDDLEEKIIKPLIEIEENDERLILLETLKEPYLFTSSNLEKIVNITVSLKTRMSMIGLIGPRLTDPNAKISIFTDMFRFSEDKKSVEDILKARTNTLNASQFKRISMQDPRSSIRAGAIGGRGGRGSNIDRASKYKSTPFISKLTSLSSSSSEAKSPSTSTIVTDIETTTNNNNNDSIRNTNQEIEDLNQTNNYNDINYNLRSNSLDSNVHKVDSHDVLSVASNDSNSSSLSASISSASVLLPMDSTSSDFISSFTISARVPQKMTPKTIQKKLPLISNNSMKNSNIGGIANNNNISRSYSNGSINDVVNTINNNYSNSINNYNLSSVSTQVAGLSSSSSSSSSSVAMIYNNRPLPTPIIKTEIDKIDTQNQVKTLRELFNREDLTSSNGLSSASATSDFKQTPFKNHSLIPTQPQTLPPRTSHHLSLMLHSNNQNFTTSYTDDNIDMKGSNYNDVVTPAKRPSYTSTQPSLLSSSITSMDFNQINKTKSSTPGPVSNALRRPNSLYTNQNNINAINNINNVITNNINNNNILLNTRSSTGNDVASRCAVVLNISKTEFLALEPEPPVIEDQYTYKELVRRNYRKEYDDLVQSNLEQYLTDEEFMIVFGRTKVEFTQIPNWRKMDLKKTAMLF